MKPTSFHISLQLETQTRFVERFSEDCGSSHNWPIHLQYTAFLVKSRASTAGLCFTILRPKGEGLLVLHSVLCGLARL